MADSLTQHVLDLLKRLGKSFNRKIAVIVMTLVNHKHAGSLGAVAGFAIAVIFTWKFLRSPGRPKRSQHKVTGSESTSSSASQIIEVTSLSGADDLCPPVKLTHDRVVRKKLNGGRKMTCQLLGVILEENSPEELVERATVRPSSVEILLEISKSCDLYLMERVLDDESEERILLALENAGLFENGGLMKDKVLFCGTENGRLSFVRQLEPDWHVDTNPEIISQLSRFIMYQLCISPVTSIAGGPNIFTSESLDSFFTETKAA